MKKKFNKVNIEISNVCNLQCSFCPEVIRDKKLMGLPLFEKIIEQVAPLTEQVCFHLMGDPLVHPKIQDFVDVCDRFNVKIFLVTNGVLLRENHQATLLHKAFRQVNFSLHSFFDNYPDRDPTGYLNTIFQFVERARAERPDLYLNYRLWNLQDVRGLGSRNREMLERIENQYQVKLNLDVDVRQRKSVHIKDRLYLHFDTEFIWPSLELPVLGTAGTCYGLSSHFGILVDGTVVPCCLDKEGDIPLGNVQTQSLTEILNSERALAVLNGFKKQKLAESLCQRCQYIERFDSKKQNQSPEII